MPSSSSVPYPTVAEWPTVSLIEVTTKIGSGATPRGGAATYLPVRENFAFVRSQNIFDRRFDTSNVQFINDDQAATLSGTHLQAEDVLLNITGDGITFGRAAMVDKDVLPACVNQHVAIIRADPQKVMPGYLLAYLTHPDVKPYIASFNSGGSRRAVTKGHIESFRLPLPPLDEQRAIAATLGALDDKIESNRRASYLASNLLDAISESISDDLPSIPLGDLITVVKDSLNPTTLNEMLVDHYSLPAFDAGARPERPPASAIKSNKLAVPKYAILISRLNPRFNRTWWVTTSEAVPSLASTEFLVLTTPSPLDLAGVWLAVRDQLFMEELTRRVTGTSGSHQRVRPDDALAIEVPNVSVLDSEAKKRALALLRKIDHLRFTNDQLTALRDALLPELLSGRIRVPVKEALA